MVEVVMMKGNTLFTGIGFGVINDCHGNPVLLRRPG